MNKCLLSLMLILLLLPFSLRSQSQGQASMEFDYFSALAMMEVIEAIHHNEKPEVVEKLLSRALEFEAYKVSHDRYTDTGRSRENQVTLTQFRKFMLSLSKGQADTQNNRRLSITKPPIEDAIINPGKYRKALRIIETKTADRFQTAFETALAWLPDEPDLDIHVWILFDIGGSGAWAFQTLSLIHI